MCVCVCVCVECMLTYACIQGGISDEGSHAIAKSILLEMGEYFQIQVR